MLQGRSYLLLTHYPQQVQKMMQKNDIEQRNITLQQKNATLQGIITPRRYKAEQRTTQNNATKKGKMRERYEAEQRYTTR